ncbi:MAG TPA: DUF3563 domain-containing protein [Paraburkholderia sp.]|jgi:hypothetical protein
MLAYLIEAFGDWLKRAERQPCYAYLSSSADLAVLEQRVRAIGRTTWR